MKSHWLTKVLSLVFSLVLIVQTLPMNASAADAEEPEAEPEYTFIYEDMSQYEGMSLPEIREARRIRYDSDGSDIKIYLDINDKQSHEAESEPTKSKRTPFATTTFADFFPDEAFANFVAKRFNAGYTKDSPITETDLKTRHLTISMTDDRVKSIEGIGYLVNLDEMDLYGSSVETITEDFGKCVNVTQLDLSENNIRYYPDCFANMDKCWYLNIGQQLAPGESVDIPLSIAEMNVITRLEAPGLHLTEIPVELTVVLTNGAGVKTPGNNGRTGDIMLRDSHITEIPDVYISLLTAGENLSICNQTATIPGVPVFTSFDDMNFEDVVPKIVYQLKSINQNRFFSGVTGFIEVKLDGQSNRFSLTQLFSPTFKPEDLFNLGDGVYDIEYNTFPQWDWDGTGYNGARWGCLNGKGHNFFYQIDISTGYDMNNSFAAAGTSQNGSYSLTMNGHIDEYFSNGTTTLTPAQVKAMNINGIVVNNAKRTETKAISFADIDDAVVEVVKGELIEIKFSGTVMTKSGKKDSFSVTAKTNASSPKTFALTNTSMMNEYEISVSGLLPANLHEGTNLVISPVDIRNLKMSGLLYNTTTGEARKLTTNALTWVQIDVAGGQIVSISGKASHKTANGIVDDCDFVSDFTTP